MNPPGLPDSEVVSIRRQNLGPSMAHYYSRPLHVHRGSMQWLWDTSGKRYLDFFGGIVTVKIIPVVAVDICTDIDIDIDLIIIVVVVKKNNEVE